MDDLFDNLSEWERLIAEMVFLLPNEEEALHAMTEEDLARLTQTLYALAASVEVVASERLPDIREATTHARAAIRMYAAASEVQRRSFDVVKAV
jgi:sugar/nucleoside kinase (ribokinase family)